MSMVSNVVATYLVVLLRFTSIHLTWQAVRSHRSIQDRVLVHVLDKHGLTDGGLVVQAGAAISMTAHSAKTTAGGVRTRQAGGPQAGYKQELGGKWTHPILK